MNNRANKEFRQREDPNPKSQHLGLKSWAETADSSSPLSFPSLALTKRRKKDLLQQMPKCKYLLVTCKTNASDSLSPSFQSKRRLLQKCRALFY